MLPFLAVLTPILDKALSFIPDPQKREQIKLDTIKELNSNSQAILSALTEVDKAQIAVNVEEAKSGNLFVSGWRPALGWVCASAFTWQYVLQPIVAFILAACGKSVVLPVIDFSAMSPLMMGMLGLVGARTWEKSQGVASK